METTYRDEIVCKYEMEMVHRLHATSQHPSDDCHYYVAGAAAAAAIILSLLWWFCHCYYAVPLLLTLV